MRVPEFFSLLSLSVMQSRLGALTLWGRSRAADSTGFVIPELEIQLDAGVIVSSAKPKVVLISHSHADHSFRTTHLTSRTVVPTFFVPRGLEPFFHRFIRAASELSGNTTELEWEENCKLVGVEPNDTFLLPHKRDFRVRVFEMDHSVKTVGFGLSKVKQKLKAEFAGLRGDAIGKLRQEGVAVTEELEEKLFVFCGDTTPKCFEISPDLLTYPIVIVECSFLFEEDAKKAADSKHTLWKDLKVCWCFFLFRSTILIDV